MRLNYILKYIGLVLLLMAVFVFISATVAAEDGRDASTIPLLLSGTLIGVLGLFPQFFVHKPSKLSRAESYVVVAGAWLTACIAGALPYLMFGGPFNVVNSLFESVSGFTTTGASILNDIESLPQGLLFWRMSTAWIGGIGIVVMFSLLMPAGSSDGIMLTGVEVSDIARSNNGMKSHSLVQIMVITYVALTVLTILALRLCGMRWFDAVAHAMSCCSTCGFSTKNASIAAYSSPAIEYVIIISILLSSMRFTLLYKTFRPRKKEDLETGKFSIPILKSETTRVFLGIFAAASLLVCGNLIVKHTYDSVSECLREAMFQVASLATTTGFATADTNLWPQMSILVLFLCCFVCGCSGSTSGGIKTDRIVLLIKSVSQKFDFIHNPNRVKCVKIDGHIASDSLISDCMQFTLLYLFIVAAGAFLNVIAGLDIKSGVTAAVACMGNVGPGFGAVGSMNNYAALPSFVKVVSMLLMLLGRLEIFPLLVLFSRGRE